MRSLRDGPRQQIPFTRIYCTVEKAPSTDVDCSQNKNKKQERNEGEETKKKIAVGYADKANKSRNEEQTSSRENKTETSAENNKTTNNNNSSNNIKTTTTTARAAKICNINIFVSQTVLVGA